jgi:5-methyltetrahydropteroyltriglutamate--homocysteine methyltransferase
MAIPTEPIGSIPRPRALLDALKSFEAGDLTRNQLEPHYEAAIKDTIARFEGTGSPLITDGEQRKPSFLTYPLEGAPNLEPGGVEIPFADGHVRRLPRLVKPPFRYQVYAGHYLEAARPHGSVPMKQAVIAPSALSLLYPEREIAGYPRAAFLDDLVDEAERDIRSCFAAGAQIVQMDFTEGRLALKIDPTKRLLNHFIALNNRVLHRFTHAERARIGIHTCPGGDRDSTHSADVPYAELLPRLFEMRAPRFYIELAGERDPEAVLRMLRSYATGPRVLFLGVINPIDPEVETAGRVEQRVLQALEHISPSHLGTTDDCGFSPFGDDTSTARDIAFAKITARVEGTRRASEHVRA